MAWNIRIVSTYPPRRCGIGTFSKDLSNALSQFTGEVGHIRIAAIDNGHGPYNIPVDLVIDQYNPAAWKNITREIVVRAPRKATIRRLLFYSMSTGWTRTTKDETDWAITS